MWWLFLACSVPPRVLGVAAEGWSPAPDTGPDEVLPVETCNGADDDGDGLVDEDFSDYDGDGTADCVDADCVVESAAPVSESDPTCVSAVSSGGSPASAAVLWQWVPNEANFVMPVAADLEGDGDVEVIASDGARTTGSCDLVVLDGATGTEQARSASAIACWGGLSLADLDGDGDIEIIGVSATSAPTAIAAWNADLSLVWANDQSVFSSEYPFVVDLDGDGASEVLSSVGVIDGATGATLSSWHSDDNAYRQPLAADMDGDGVLEILADGSAWSALGEEVLYCAPRTGDGAVLPVQLDVDPEPELLTMRSSRVTSCDSDGTQLWSATITNAYETSGTPSAADFDHDGLTEVLIPNLDRLRLLDQDGAALWETPISDPDGANGAALWDIDGDGVPEILYADEQTFYIFSAADGSVLYQQEAHDSRTPHNTPTVVDVDMDGHGEILFQSDLTAANAPGTVGLTVLYDPSRRWAAAPRAYPGQGWDGVSLDEGLQVVASPPSWTTRADGVLRGQAPYVPYGPDLQVEVTGLCRSRCLDGAAQVAVQVWNAGAASSGGTLELWSNPGGVRTLLATDVVPRLPAGSSVELAYDASTSTLGDRLWAEVSSDIAECRPTNNSGELAVDPCE